MATGEAKLHHFVPRFYLARWSHVDLLDVRRRDGGRFTAKPTKVAAINGFYDFHDDDGEVSKAVEKFLADEVEAPASEAFRSIDASGRAPAPHTSERQAMCAFIAFQMTRTPERRAEIMLAEAVRAFLDGRELTEPLMAEYLESVHLGFAPSEREVRAAVAWIGYQLYQLGTGTREEAMRIMHSIAVEFMPKLAEMHWSIAVDRKQRFVTADQPVLIWKQPSPRDAFMGVGLQTADEVRLPLDPGKVLVLRHRPRTETVRLSPSEVQQCNRDIAHRCHTFIVGSPRQSATIDSLPLRARGPAMRFNVANRWDRDDDGRLFKTDEEILHTWVSRD